MFSSFVVFSALAVMTAAAVLYALYLVLSKLDGAADEDAEVCYFCNRPMSEDVHDECGS